MRREILFPVTGAVVFTVASCFAQTPIKAEPAATQEEKQQMPALPAYRQQPAPLSVPAQPQTPVDKPGDVNPAPVDTNPTPVGPGARPPYRGFGVLDEDKKKDSDGSTYIPVDSWVYPEMLRLYSLGYVDTMFVGMRPWTRKSVFHMLEESEDDILNSDSDEAKEIYAAVSRELQAEDTNEGVHPRGTVYGTHSVYTRLMGISGNTLRDSYHIGQTIVNDYGRPYEPGFNNLTGVSALAERGRFSLYVRGEYQHAPSAVGYSQALSSQLSLQDNIAYSGFNLHQATIPTGPIAAQNPFRLVEATLSFHVLGHEISGGKSDAWLGPGQGGSLAWSNNAENIYQFKIDRVEPLYIPYLSKLIGTLRYQFFYGSLKGHTAPNNPYVHSESFALRPTQNFEFGFERTQIFGGDGHSPVTFAKFFKGFFSVSDTGTALKFSRDDPGARFSAFNASYRLPLLRKYVTFLVDSEAHDDVTPISAPRRAAYRTGLYVSQIPGVRKLDFRVEAVSTDPGVSRSISGNFNYFETIQLQGYTNKGFIMGDWIGREAKGGQAWFTYHLSGDEWIQIEYLNKKTPKDFVTGVLDVATNTRGPGGATQNSYKATVVKRFLHDNVELNAWFQYERWKAPIYLPGLQTNTTTAVQLTFFPALKKLAAK